MRLPGSRVTRTKCGLDLPLLNQPLQSSPVLVQAADVLSTVSQEDAGGAIFKMCNSNWDHSASFLWRSMHTCSLPHGPGWTRHGEAFQHPSRKLASSGLTVPMSNQNPD
jgi:hypothetical protein